MPVPAFSGVHHAKIPVSDLSRSLEWYERVLGARRLPDLDHRSESGAVYAHVLEMPGVPFVIELRTAPKRARALSGFDPLTYSVATREDLGDWITHLDALGVDHSRELRGIVGWLLVLRDPDGMAIRLHTDEQHEFDETNADANSPWLRPSAG